MAIYIYRSTDTSAPQLTGQVGKLIPILDACLVNGYGSKTPMGQTKPYSGTNVATYKMPVGTSQTFLAVDATPTNVPRLRGFTDMSGTQSSALGTGSAYSIHPFPTDAQSAGGESFVTSATTDAVVRPWVLISNGKLMYFQVDSASDGGASGRLFVFGDIASYNPNETNSCILIGGHTTNRNYSCQTTQVGSVTAAHQLCMRYDGLSWSEACGFGPINAYQHSNYPGYVGGAMLGYPDPIIGGMILSPFQIFEPSSQANVSILRGRMSGLQAPCTGTGFNTGDTFTGTVGDLAGRTFEAFKYNTSNGSTWFVGFFFIEISDTWDDVHFK